MLKKVIIHDVIPNSNPKFVETIAVKYQREGGPIKTWEMVTRHASVHVMVYNKTTSEFLLVKQFRVPVFVSNNGLEENPGYVYEACAGLIDSESTPEEIVQNEVLEELGYKIELDQITPVRYLKSSVGLSGNDTFTYYVELSEDQRVNDGGGLPDEDIEVIRVPYENIFDFIYDPTITTDAITIFLAMHGYAVATVDNKKIK